MACIQTASANSNNTKTYIVTYITSIVSGSGNVTIVLAFD